MSLSGFTLPPMENEPVLGYLPGSPERKSLQDELKRQSQEVVEIPCIINGEEVWTGNIVEQVMPHKHAHVIARVHLCLLYTSPSPRDVEESRMPSSA